MALKDDLLPLVDELRAIPGDLGFRPFEVYVRKKMYAGPRIGVGAVTTTETRLLVGGQNPKVREKRSKDVVAGTPEAQDSIFEIGPLTPAFAGGGIDEEVINPTRTATPTTFLFLLKGPGLPEEGLLCQRIEGDTDRPLRYIVRVRSIGRRGE